MFQRRSSQEPWDNGEKLQRGKERYRLESLDLWYPPLFPSAEQFAAVSSPNEAIEERTTQEEIRLRSRTRSMQSDIAIRAGKHLLILDPNLRAYSDLEHVAASRLRRGPDTRATNLKETKSLEDLISHGVNNLP